MVQDRVARCFEGKDAKMMYRTNEHSQIARSVWNRQFLCLETLAFVVILAGLGCRSSEWPSSPRFTPPVEVYGVVTFPSGNVSDDAMVWAENKPLRPSDPNVRSIHTDLLGRYSLTVVPPGDSVWIWAKNGYSSRAYAVTHTGMDHVRITNRRIRVDIVLDRSRPI